MKAKRKICVFSGKRGGFGAYVPIMKLIEQDPRLSLQILLGDMHASKVFGNTVKEAKELFLKATIKVVKMNTGRGDSPLIRTENLGTCLTNGVRILKKLSPDFVMVHGDRGEHLMIAFAALNLGIPITHSQGGDISGNIDDIQRHAITKLAHIHFPETDLAAKRIIKLGEEEWRVKNVGSTYIDRIVKKMYTPFNKVYKRYGLNPKEKYAMVLFHPDTFETKQENYRMAKQVLSSIENTGMRSFVIYPCSDPGYEGILKAIQEQSENKNFMIYKNIDNLDYLSLQANAQLLIGNSSSALVEAPYFQLPAINIGKRQLGRDREKNVIDAKPAKKDIDAKIKYALTNKQFQKTLKKCGMRLGNGKAGEKMLAYLKRVPINEKLLRKRITY